MATKPKYTYHIERLSGGGDCWGPVPFTHGMKLAWCEGYVRALDDLYPSPRVRVVRNDGKVMLEGGGRGEVKVQRYETGQSLVKRAPKLVSDFTDCYDHWFAGTDARGTFSRMAGHGQHRSLDHDLLESAGFQVPPRGIHLALLAPGKDVVIYDDPHAHRGDGKRRAKVKDIHAGEYAIRWVGPEKGGESWRLLVLGRKMFLLSYKSTTDWRSNFDPEVRVYSGPPFYDTKVMEVRALKLNLPLAAIDFVADGDTLWALDLNTAPQVKGTGVEDIIKPKEIAEAIIVRWEELNA